MCCSKLFKLILLPNHDSGGQEWLGKVPEKNHKLFTLENRTSPHQSNSANAIRHHGPHKRCYPFRRSFQLSSQQNKHKKRKTNDEESCRERSIVLESKSTTPVTSHSWCPFFLRGPGTNENLVEACFRNANLYFTLSSIDDNHCLSWLILGWPSYHVKNHLNHHDQIHWGICHLFNPSWKHVHSALFIIVSRDQISPWVWPRTHTFHSHFPLQKTYHMIDSCDSNIATW